MAKVLIVDDEKDFTETLSERLESRGMEVETVDNGLKAVDKVENKSYDAVVLDLAMPGIDGIETLKRLLAKNPDLQVILLTGQGTVKSGVEAIKLGAMEFLEKPPNLENLVARIKDAQSRRIMLFEKKMQDTIEDILKKKSW